MTAWVASARTPASYPDAVTLRPRVDAPALLASIDTTTPGATVKDSFADLDLSAWGFRILFTAQWIHRPAAAPSAPPELAWTFVSSAAELQAWSTAWAGGDGDQDIFRPELLDDPNTHLLAARDGDGRIVTGAVLSRTEGTVGVSNLFTTDDRTGIVWPVVLSAVHSLFPESSVVGYERGPALAAATTHGFEAAGDLRVWAAPATGTSTA